MSLDVRGEMFTVITIIITIIIIVIIIYLYLYLYLLWCAPKRSPPNCAKLICIYYLLQLQLSTAGKYEGVTASFLEGTLGSHAVCTRQLQGIWCWTPEARALPPSLHPAVRRELKTIDIHKGAKELQIKFPNHMMIVLIDITNYKINITIYYNIHYIVQDRNKTS